MKQYELIKVSIKRSRVWLSEIDGKSVVHDNSEIGRVKKKAGVYVIEWEDSSEDTHIETERGANILKDCQLIGYAFANSKTEEYRGE